MSHEPYPSHDSLRWRRAHTATLEPTPPYCSTWFRSFVLYPYKESIKEAEMEHTSAKVAVQVLIILVVCYCAKSDNRIYIRQSSNSGQLWHSDISTVNTTRMGKFVGILLFLATVKADMYLHNPRWAIQRVNHY